MTSVHAIVMGDPASFYIRSGSNPHTRTRWGLRKKVNLSKAEKQWHALARTFTQLGLCVVVLPPSRETPGAVFPANAGFLYPKGKTIPRREQRFYLSQLIPGRQGERPLYEHFLKRLGFQSVDAPYRFEGEADFIEMPPLFLFTSGPIVKQRFVPRWGFPPYKRLYGFRSDPRNLNFLKGVVKHKDILPLTLVDETFYHGDTLLSPFGPQKEYLLAYLPALAPSSQEDLGSFLGERLLPLSQEDAFHFAANSFQVEGKGEFHLILPEGVSDSLLRGIEAKGVKGITVDVSEFSEKGGGSVKCLLCDLGWIDLEDPTFSEEERHFWSERGYERLYA